MTRKFSSDAQSLVIGAGFLAIAIFFLFRLIVNLGLIGQIHPEISGAALFLRTAARWTFLAMMLLASFLPVGRRVSPATANAIVTASGLFATIVGFLLLVFWKHSPWEHLPTLNPSGTRVAEIWDILGYSAMVLSTFLSYRYGRIAFKNRDPSLFFIAVAMASAIPREFVFTLANSENDLLILVGNLLGACGFLLIFIALQKKSLITPYEQLSRTQKQLESAIEGLQSRTEELINANTELETFSYSVAHDLRNPLQTIISCNEVLQEEANGKQGSTEQKALAYIVKAAERMSSTISALQVLTRITQHELRKERVDLSDIARAIFQELKASDPQRSVEVLVAPNLFALADRRLVTILLKNLIRNAWKFTAKAASARIEFGAENNGGSIAFFVRDNGVGFDMANAAKIFKPFQRLHPDKEFPGSGIGLATVKRIIDKHGGKVWAESKPQKGATFFFTLP